MYARRVHTALGRSRPAGNEVSKITDGVIASMRQLHISVRNLEEGSSLNRTERSRIAAAEITSVSPSTPSRGIDARSLRAEPPPASTFKITRVDVGAGRGGRIGSNGGRGGSPSSYRGGTFVSRGSGGGMIRPSGRGGARGSARDGARGGRGRGRGRGGQSARGGRRNREAGDRKAMDGKLEEEQYYTVDEYKFVRAQEYGVVTPAIVGRTTTLESLREFAPSWPMTTTGIKNSIKESMKAVSGGGNFDSVDEINNRLHENTYVSFRNEKDKETVLHKILKKKPITPVGYAGGNNKIMRELVGGEYDAVKSGSPGDALGVVQKYARINKSYSSRDMSKIMGKVRTLLPKEEGKEARPNAK